MKNFIFALLLLVLPLNLFGASLLVPMDSTQADHLKAYGLVYKSLARGHKAEWLLNYRCGSFLLPATDDVANEALLMGVTTEQVWEERAALYPPGRVATPQEVAELIAFLASEESSGISGEAIRVALGSVW